MATKTTYTYRIRYLIMTKATCTIVHTGSADLEWDKEIYSNEDLKKIQDYLFEKLGIEENYKLFISNVYLLYTT